MKKIMILATASCLAFNALAEEVSNKDFYVQLSAGPSFGQKPKGDFKKDDLGTSGLYGVAFGYKLHENFRADLSVDYRPGYENKYSESEEIESINYDKTYKVKVKSLTSMLNLYYDIAKVNGFTPYVTSGLGFSRNKTNKYEETSNSNEDDSLITTVYDKGKQTSFVWKVGLGSKYEINQNFDLDLRYQYADLGKFRTSSTSYIESDKYEEGAKKGSITSHEVLVGIAYKF